MSVVKASWSPSSARGAGSAPPAMPGAWSRPPPTWSTTYFRRFRFDSGCCRCPNACATFCANFTRQPLRCAILASLAYQPKPSWLGRSLLHHSSPSCLGGGSRLAAAIRSCGSARAGIPIRSDAGLVSCTFVAPPNILPEAGGRSFLRHEGLGVAQTGATEAQTSQKRLSERYFWHISPVLW